MAFYRKMLTFKTEKIYDFIDVTDEIEETVKYSEMENGIVSVNTLHNTAALILQEADETIHHDMQHSLERLFPASEKHEHDYEGQLNATAHLKSNFLGSFVTIPLTGGKLELGTWQRVFFVELFEPRTRKIVVTIAGE